MVCFHWLIADAGRPKEKRLSRTASKWLANVKLWHVPTCSGIDSKGSSFVFRVVSKRVPDVIRVKMTVGSCGIGSMQ